MKTLNGNFIMANSRFESKENVDILCMNITRCCICKINGNEETMISLDKALKDVMFVEAIVKLYPEFVSTSGF